VCIVYAYLACGIETNQNQAVRVLSTTARKQSAHLTTLHCILPSASLQLKLAILKDKLLQRWDSLQLRKIFQGDPTRFWESKFNRHLSRSLKKEFGRGRGHRRHSLRATSPGFLTAEEMGSIGNGTFDARPV